MIRERRRAVALVALAIILALLVATGLTGCSSQANARAAATADESVHAGMLELAQGHDIPDLSEAQVAAIEDWIDGAMVFFAGARDLLAPVRAHLDPDQTIEPAMPAQAMREDPQTYQRMVAAVAEDAQQENRNRGVWRAILRWVGTAAESLLGITLGGLGLASGATGVALAVRRAIKTARALADSVGFGEEADAIVQQYAPPEIQHEWRRRREQHATQQEQHGTREVIRKRRKRPPAPVVLTAGQANQLTDTGP